MSVKVGDKVRFLNTTGGGVIKRIVSKDLVEVEDQDGFDVPTLIKEIVVIESTVAEQKKENSLIHNQKPKDGILQEQEPVEDEEEFPETKEGEKLNVLLGFVACNKKELSTSLTEFYLINDSNYYLAYNIFGRDGEQCTSRAAGFISPNTKMMLETLSKEQLVELENLQVQLIAMKKDKPYAFKPAYDIKVKVNAVKFYKLHSYTVNDFFNEDAILYQLIKDDEQQDVRGISKDELGAMLQSKETKIAARVSKKSVKTPEVIEIDLHIDELVDSTVGLSNKDMLDLQMKEFHKVMKENLSRKGQKIVFIHGKGEGVLRKEILQALRKNYSRCESQDASFLEYGFGATQVTIR